MIIYVETNFVLELALQQGEAPHCEELLDLAEAGVMLLAFPAFSLSEPYWGITQRGRSRNQIKRMLEQEVRELDRTQPYGPLVDLLRPAIQILTEIEPSELSRLETTTDRMLSTGHCIPTTGSLFTRSRKYQTRLGMYPLDALIYVSVLSDIEAQSADGRSWFISRDRKAFSDPDLISELQLHNCDFLSKFVDAVRVVQRFSA